jgi:hypothetical protein
LVEVFVHQEARGKKKKKREEHDELLQMGRTLDWRELEKLVNNIATRAHEIASKLETLSVPEIEHNPQVEKNSRKMFMNRLTRIMELLEKLDRLSD